MGIKEYFGFGKQPEAQTEIFVPAISDGNELNINEQFKGEVENNKIKFPVELGEAHPFDFKTVEGLYKKFGFFTAVVDKYIDFVVGPGFYVTSDDDRVKEIIDEFMKDVNFDTLLRQWAKEALVKGNGFLEIGGSKQEGVKGLTIRDANYMYVNRDKHGKILNYNQYTGGFNNFEKGKVISFKPENIAHVPFNVIGDCAYGLGIGYPAMNFINSYLQQNNNMHFIMDRKANSPLHAKLGKVDGTTKIIPKAADVTAFGKKMEIMHKKIDWATDDLVDFKVVDFGNIGEKFDKVLEHDIDMLIYAFQIPAVLLGMSNINEGIARVQMEAFQRRIQSIQAELEKIIEDTIFKRVLEANGFTDASVEFEWGTPSVIEVEGRMQLISDLIKSPTTSIALKQTLEDEMVLLLKLDEDEWEKIKLEMEAKEEEERKRLEAQPQPIVPGQNKRFPQKVAPKAAQPTQPKVQADFKLFTDILDKQKEKIEKLMLQQSEKSLELQIKRDKENAKLLKDVINQMQEADKTIATSQIVKKDLENEVDKLNKKVETLKKKDDKPKKQKKVSLFRPLKNEELNVNDSIKEEKKKVKKTIRKNNNYEYQKECPHCNEGFENINDVSEWLGFDYQKYLAEIIKAINKSDFSFLKGVTEAEIQAGFFVEEDITKLKKILDKGFTEGQGMTEMAKAVNKKIKPKDLYRMTEDGNIKLGVSGLPILSRSAEKRAIGIIRTEVTRLANEGAVATYKANDIKQVSWISSFGDRTCPECEGYNGQIYEINSHPAIPAHPLCRCTLSPVVELK